ncbi:MAG: hypothetical protein OJF51_001090 [Nitrospira sp.]|nr:MAG: hypothetical protein OJF51_001090 [Nitrospira sp.]
MPRRRLWFVFGRLLTLFEPELEKPCLTFRLGNVFQSERARQAILIKSALLGVGFLKGFPLKGFPIRIGYSSLGTQEVDLDGLESKDFG